MKGAQQQKLVAKTNLCWRECVKCACVFGGWARKSQKALKQMQLKEAAVHSKALHYSNVAPICCVSTCLNVGVVLTKQSRLLPANPHLHAHLLKPDEIKAQGSVGRPIYRTAEVMRQRWARRKWLRQGQTKLHSCHPSLIALPVCVPRKL